VAFVVAAAARHSPGRAEPQPPVLFVSGSSTPVRAVRPYATANGASMRRKSDAACTLSPGTKLKRASVEVSVALPPNSDSHSRGAGVVPALGLRELSAPLSAVHLRSVERQLGAWRGRSYRRPREGAKHPAKPSGARPRLGPREEECTGQGYACPSVDRSLLGARLSPCVRLESPVESIEFMTKPPLERTRLRPGWPRSARR